MQGVPERFEQPGDRAEFRRPPGQEGVELYRAHIVHHRFAPHIHDGYGLGVIEAGQERFHYRGREHLAPAGAIVLMQPGELHTGGPAAPQGWRYRMLYLEEPVLAEHLGQGRLWRFDEAVRQGDAARAGGMARALAALWSANDGAEADAALADALALLAPLAAGHRAEASAVSAGARPFERVVDALHSDLAREWRLAELAALSGLSPFHFQRAFKAAHGISPHQWRMALRLAEAKRRLAAGESPAEVAAAVGLADQAHLTRRFAGMYGVTPARYQRQLRAA
ncbi:AraC family ligand binding domain-containing protein [Ideonella sp. YS5]|uniref:AraC family ligand binding domain-containing protein n=1 Tax=Ideonella sp. YS5 TaxID=3453714 RepID=UPI003EEA84F4